MLLGLGAVPVSRDHDLTVAETVLNITGKPALGMTTNGSMPGPVLRFREGDEVVIRVTNKLRETTSIHSHGLLVPNSQDGVPGVIFPGLPSMWNGRCRIWTRPCEADPTKPISGCRPGMSSTGVWARTWMCRAPSIRWRSRAESGR